MITRGIFRSSATLAMWIAIGVAENVAVAWSLAAWLPQAGWPTQLTHGKDVVVFSYQTLGAERREWHRIWGGETVPTWPFVDAIASTRPPYSSENREPVPNADWGIADSARVDIDAFVDHGGEHATGWPMLAMWYGFQAANKDWSDLPFKIDAGGGIPLAGFGITPNALAGSTIRALPLRPMWPGFAINTLCYAAAAWTLWWVRSVVRCHLRQRSGKCMGCGYDRAGLAAGTVCPECGASASRR